MADSSETGKVVEGVFALNKPHGISSAQALRDLQQHFNPSTLFAPALAAERSRRAGENPRHHRRKKAKQSVQVKLGHGGTLDPAATGVLIVGVGAGTKALQGFLSCTKSYEATVLFGAATDSYDGAGKVVARMGYEHVTRERVEAALRKFRGKIMQRPPIFSALRIQGKRLYEYAREGKEVPVEIQERPVEVSELELVEWLPGRTHEFQYPEAEAEKEEKVVAEKLLHLGHGEDGAEAKEAAATSNGRASPSVKRKRDNSEDDTVQAASPSTKRQREDPDQPEPVMTGALPADSAESSSSQPPTHTAPDRSSTTPSGPTSHPPAARLRMTVSSGFYVRSLCHDLGQAVDSLAFMASLVRSRQGDFELGKNVLEYDELAKGEDAWGPKVECALDEWNEIEGSTALTSAGAASNAAQKEVSDRNGTLDRSELPADAVVQRRNSSSAEP